MDKVYKKSIIILIIFGICYLGIALLPEIKTLLIFLFRVLLPFIIGFVLAFLLLPIVDYLQQKGASRKISVLIVIIIIIALLVTLFASIVPTTLLEITHFIDALPEYLQKITTFLDKISLKLAFLPAEYRPTSTNIENWILANSDFFTNRLIAFFQTSFSYFYTIIISPIIMVYFLLDFDRVVRLIKRYSKKWQKEEIITYLRNSRDSIKGYFKGIFLVAILVTAMSTVSFWFLDIKYALLLGVIIGITDIIPYLGPYIGGGIAFLITLTDSLHKAIIVLIVVVVVQFIESSFLTPKIQSHHLQTHPLLVLLFLAFFGEIMGILGFLIAVPILALVQNLPYFRKMEE